MRQHTYRDQERSRAAAWKSGTAVLSIEARADARYIGKTGAPGTPSWHSGCGGGPSNHLAVMTVAWDLHYDRRVSDGFLDHFLNGGVAHSLAEYARFAPYPLDLQMRHDPKTGAEHATLYVGLTSVLGVKRKKDLLQLEGHKSPAAAECGFQADWAKPMTAEELRTVWRAVEDYLEAIIPIAAAKHASKEGAVQAAASVFSSNKRIMVDREVALHFKDVATKKRIFAEITAPLVTAIKGIPGVPGKPPASFGGACDLLALDRDGRLLAVEVKPRATGTLVWSGVQATVYARLFERWIQAPPRGTDAAATILRGMLEQRARLGLAPTSRPGIAERPIVVPIVAIQRGASATALERMRKVQAALLEAGCGDPNFEIYEVSMTGRMDRLG